MQARPAPPEILICEVGPRDGLQSESLVLSASSRAEFCNQLARTGLQRIEAVSFVSPRRVPPMADAEGVLGRIDPGPDVVWTGLVLNERGYDRARACGLSRVNVTVGVTDAFCRNNQGRGLAEVLRSTKEVIARAEADAIQVTVTLAVAFGCPFERAVPADSVLEVAAQLVGGAVDELVLADTIAVAAPGQVADLVSRLDTLGRTVGCHFHGPGETALPNVAAAVDAGARLFDGSISGIGGCPFAPGATGNIPTDELVRFLDELGIDHGIDLDRMTECSDWLSAQLGRSWSPGVTPPLAGA